MSREQQNPGYVIFGATGGIGRALVSRLSSARLVVIGRDASKVESLAREHECHFCVADACDPDQVASSFETARKELDVIDGVASCVGSLMLKPAHITTNDEWNATIRTNLDSAFHILKYGVKAMRRSGGSIVLMSSAAARVGIPNHEAIAAAKAGIEGLALSAAASYATQNIRVNCVAPGLVRTPLTASLTSSPAAEKISLQMHALGRLGEPNDIAEAISWLLQTSWVTGQVIGVDGGLSNIRPRATG